MAMKAIDNEIITNKYKDHIILCQIKNEFDKNKKSETPPFSSTSEDHDVLNESPNKSIKLSL